MFTRENAREMQMRGLLARMERTTPERRSLAAKRAALARWYPLDGSPLDRVNCHLRYLAKMSVHFELEGDYAGAARTVMAMLPYERMKIALEFRAKRVKDVTPAPAETKSDEQIVTQFGDASRSPKKTNLLN